jgi:nucleoside-diphosphate-sugar epimerase
MTILPLTTGTMWAIRQHPSHRVFKHLRHLRPGYDCTSFGNSAPSRLSIRMAPVRWFVSERGECVTHLGTGRGWSVRELVNSVRRITNSDVSVRIGPRRRGDPPILIADSTRASQKLGWQPRHRDLDTIVADAWAWQQIRARRNDDRS